LDLSPDTSVLVTGASGALGWSLVRYLAPKCRVTGTYLLHESVPEGAVAMRMDLADPRSIDSVLASCRPAVIVHAAAMADPDRCEREPDRARAVNVTGSRRIARHASGNGAALILISTDLVFDGKGGDYEEEDEACPLSIYGATKLAAERDVLAENGEAAVIRSSLIYGWGSPASGTFFTGFHSSMSSGERMRLFTDQIRNPVLIDDLVRAISLAVELDLRGLYHVGGDEALSRFEFGEAVCDVFGFERQLLEPICMEDFEYLAARPLNCTLNTGRFRAATGFNPRCLRDGLLRLRKAM